MTFKLLHKHTKTFNNVSHVLDVNVIKRSWDGTMHVFPLLLLSCQ